MEKVMLGNLKESRVCNKMFQILCLQQFLISHARSLKSRGMQRTWHGSLGLTFLLKNGQECKICPFLARSKNKPTSWQDLAQTASLRVSWLPDSF